MASEKRVHLITVHFPDYELLDLVYAEQSDFLRSKLHHAVQVAQPGEDAGIGQFMSRMIASLGELPDAF